MKDELVICQTGQVVQNCLEKVRFFIDRDAYPVFDVLGQRYEHETDRFERPLFAAMDKVMMARASYKAWDPYLDTPLVFLAAIPTNVDLVTAPENDYQCARELLRDYYLTMASVSGITDMASSKMLYLKRPRLTAISDSYVREALRIPAPDSRQYPWKAPHCAQKALLVSDAVRAIGQENLELLEWLQEEVCPAVLSLARLIDILLWVDMAILAGHRMWRAQALLRSWTAYGQPVI